MMLPLDEAQVEIATVDSFRELGYEYGHGPVIAQDGERPERTDYGQVVLMGRLRNAALAKALVGEIRILRDDVFVEGAL